MNHQSLGDPTLEMVDSGVIDELSDNLETWHKMKGKIHKFLQLLYLPPPPSTHSSKIVFSNSLVVKRGTPLTM